MSRKKTSRETEVRPEPDAAGPLQTGELAGLPEPPLRQFVELPQGLMEVLPPPGVRLVTPGEFLASEGPVKHAFQRSETGGWYCPVCTATETDPVAVHERTDCTVSA